MDGNIVMNVEFVWDNVRGNPTEVQVVPCNIAWEDLELMLKVYSDQSCLTVKYLDEENDEISVNSQTELLEAFRLAKKSSNTLHLKVYCAQPRATASASPVADAAVAHSDDDQVVELKIEVEKKEEKASPPSEARPEAKPLFYIKHQASGKVLDVEGHNAVPGTRIILWDKKVPQRGVNVRNQLWFEDPETETIRSAVNNLCITVKINDIARMEDRQEGNVHQMWKFENNRLQNKHRSNWLAVASDNNRLVLGCEENGAQKWTWVLEPAEKAQDTDATSPSGNYSKLLEEIRKATKNGTKASGGAEQESGLHVIFKESFEKFKSEMADEISRKTAQRTVDGVLQGLESAVITSVSSGNTSRPEQKGNKIPKDTNKPPMYCHFGVICDICENTIVGPRYKCGHCADFDLCEECEVHSEVHHNPDHVFLKIRRPVALAGREDGAPLLHFNVSDRCPRQSSAPVVVDNWSPVDEQLQKLTDRDMVKMERRQLRCQAKKKRKEERKMKREEDKREEKSEPSRNSDKNSLSSEDGATQTEISVKETEVQTGANLLSANELLSFEMLNDDDLKNPPTIVPTNTPVVMSPPKSPIPDDMVDACSLLSGSTSSVELVEDQQADTEEEHRSYADERLGSMELKPRSVTVEDVGSDMESDSDFIVVPIPDCFNPDLPPSTSSSTSIIIKKAEEEREVSVDEMLTVSRNIESPLLEPETVLEEGNVGQDIENEAVASVSDDDDWQNEEEEEEVKEEVVVVVAAEEAASTVPHPVVDDLASAPGAESDVTIIKVNELNSLTDDGEPEVEIHVENIPRNRTSSSVVSSAVRFAHSAATQAYSTAKDVFHTLQAHNQYVPPQQNWQPPSDQDDWTPINTEDSFMQTLFEMGFGNRDKNQKLLEKYNFDLDRVIQDLIQENENEWSETRH